VRARDSGQRCCSLWAFLASGGAAFCAWVFLGKFGPAWDWAIVPLVATAVIAMVPRSKLSVIYDGGCGICRTTAAWMASFNWSRRLALVDLHRWEEVQAIHGGLDRDACIRDMHAVTANGKVLVGYDAYRARRGADAARLQFAPIMALPGVSVGPGRITVTSRTIAGRRRAQRQLLRFATSTSAPRCPAAPRPCLPGELHVTK
jgi:predicted DCC family thiol-disulfide oxidoreductase YuxK